jgi:putative transposase
MVRRPRVEVEGGLFHVYNRVASGEPIFLDPNEAVEFIETIRETKKRDGWTVLAWCVMSNHYLCAAISNVMWSTRLCGVVKPMEPVVR